MKRKSQKGVWLALGYTVLLYASLYFVPRLTGILDRSGYLTAVLATILFLSGASAVLILFRRYRIRRFQAYVYFSLLGGLFLILFLKAPTPVEGIHYPEYGLMFVLWFRVFRPYFPGIGKYIAAFLLCNGFSLLDEGIQWWLPNRYFQWHDLGLNSVGIFLGLSATAVVMRYRLQPGVRKG